METDNLRSLLTAAGADIDLSLSLLEKINSGALTTDKPTVAGFPEVGGDQILDLREEADLAVSTAEWEAYVRRFHDGREPGWGRHEDDQLVLSPDELRQIGLQISQQTAFGILNGGSATSYGDFKKNKALGQEVFELYQADLERLAPLFQGVPKGISPAFFQPDGTPGPSYLELKMRNLLILRLLARWTAPTDGPGLRAFQMTSGTTHEALAQAYQKYKHSHLLDDLIRETGFDITEFDTAQQGLVAAYTPAAADGKRQIFTFEKDGRQQAYALPGGHGQNFRVLSDIYRGLLVRGYRYVYLGNVDNLGFLPGLKSLALLALKGNSAGFDFSFKTAVDIKGGVLFQNPDGSLNCGDIGVAISNDKVQEALAQGKSILFNCATGLFDLDYLVRHLDRIIEHLPLRLSDQDKDIGKYAQVEQVTWEVIPLLEKPLVFGVEKTRRFLAAKLLVDCLLTSGRHLDAPLFQEPAFKGIHDLAAGLNQGLERLLAGPYGMKLVGTQWQPMTVTELEQAFKQDGLARFSL